MNRKVLLSVMSLLLLASPTLAGCSSNEIKVSSEEISIDVKTTSVYEGYLNQGSIFTGTIEANEEITIVPKVAGRIATIPVEVGTNVEQGDILFTIENEDYLQQKNQSEAAVGAAQSGVEAAQSSYESAMIAAENNFHQAQATVAQLQNSLEELEATAEKAQQNLTVAQNNYNRSKQLYETGAIAKTQLEQAETAFTSAKASMASVETNKKTVEEQLKAAQIALENATTQLEIAKRNSQVLISEEQLKQAQAALEIANHTLEETIVRSPITGAVVEINSDEGELVSTQSKVMVVSDLSQARVIVYIPADEINDIEVGDLVQVKTVAADLLSFGSVENISPSNEQGKGYRVEIVVSNEKQALKPGMVSEVMFIEDEQQKGLIIPKSALLEKDGKTYVYTNIDNKAKLTEVEVVDSNTSQVLISSGLKPNDQVITTKIDILENNMNIH